jgi:cell division protein FtsQ
MKNILKITGWIVLIAGVFVILGFVKTEHSKISCKSFNIKIENSIQNRLIDADLIKTQIYTTFDTLVGKRLADINLNEVEQMLVSYDHIAKAEVFTSLNGNLNIKITEREPVLRIINKRNESFYMDNEGELFPLSEISSVRVPVASGNISATENDTVTIENLDKMDVSEMTNMQKLYIINKYIQKDSFLQAQIEQIYINKSNEFELIPKVGRHIILFGDADNIESKFEKLVVFYKQGIQKAGWKKYKTINLKYRNQVICSK